MKLAVKSIDLINALSGKGVFENLDKIDMAHPH